VSDLGHLSKNQKKILGNLEIKPGMTTKELAEMVFGKIVGYKTKEYASVYRSLVSLERQGLIQRVHVQLRWRRIDKKGPPEKL
jgi:Fe2+ or Zn2+ uptake regulation protein